MLGTSFPSFNRPQNPIIYRHLLCSASWWWEKWKLLPFCFHHPRESWRSIGPSLYPHLPTIQKTELLSCKDMSAKHNGNPSVQWQKEISHKRKYFSAKDTHPFTLCTLWHPLKKAPLFIILGSCDLGFHISKRLASFPRYIKKRSVSLILTLRKNGSWISPKKTFKRNFERGL